MNATKKLHSDVEAFAAKHLAVLCSEVLQMKETAIMPEGGRLRELFQMCQGFGISSWHSLGTGFVTNAALKFAATNAVAQTYTDGVPDLNPRATCCLVSAKPGKAMPTQCPRCNNPHHACDQGIAK